MSTPSQIAANQANAQQSSGPKTETGKAASSQNRRSHSLTGAFCVMPWEIQEEFDALRASLLFTYEAKDSFEIELVEKMAEHHWMARRAMLFQERLMHDDYPMCEPVLQGDLALYLRYQTTHERAFQRCANELRSIKKQEENRKIGFESQKRRQAEDARKQAQENRRQERHKLDILLADAKLDHQKVRTSSVRQSIATASQSESSPLAAQKAA